MEKDLEHTLEEQELEAVSGGGRSGGGTRSDPKFKVGQDVYYIKPRRIWAGRVRSIKCEDGIWCYVLNDMNGLSSGTAYEYDLQG